MLVRIITSTVISLVVVIPSIQAGKSLGQAVLSALPFFLAAAGGFALNDYYDADKDAINKPYRAIPSGRVSATNVFAIAIVLMTSAFVTAILVSAGAAQLFLYSLSIVGVCVYNYLVKHYTLSKNVVTALVSTLPIVYVILFLGYPSIYMLVPAASVLFLLGREWLMDIRDVSGDAQSGVRTLPMRIGHRRTAQISFVALYASLALLLLFVLQIPSKWLTSLLLLMSFSLTLALVLWRRRDGARRRLAVLSLWIPMNCGILMLLK